MREFPPSDVPELRLRSRRAPGAVRPWAFALPPASGFRKSEEGGFSFRASRRGGPFRRPRSAAVFPLTSPQRRHFSFERPGVRRFSLDAPECGSFPLRTCRRRHFSFERPGVRRFSLDAPECGSFPLRTCRRRHFSFERPGVRYFFFRRPGMREFPPSDVPERGDSLPDEPPQPWDGLPFRGKLRNNSPARSAWHFEACGDAACPQGVGKRILWLCRRPPEGRSAAFSFDLT